MKILTKTATFRAAFAAAAITAIAAIPMAANADTTITLEYGGVSWDMILRGNGKANLKSCTQGTATVFDVANIPWTFEYDNETYTVTEISTKAFYQKNFLTGTVTLPAAITWVGTQVFDQSTITGFSWGCTYASIPDWTFSTSTMEMPSVMLPASVTSIGRGAFAHTRITGCLIRGSASVNTYNTFNDSSPLKVVLCGPDTKGTNLTTSNNMVGGTKGCTIFAPRAGWDGFATPGGTGTTLVLYGEGEDCDIAIDEAAKTLTATIGDGNGTGTTALQAVLDNAGRFKEYFGLDTRIAVTNTLASSVTVSGDVLQNATFVTYVTFAANTQEQLDAILAALPASMPIVIDATSASKTINVPADRNVAVLVPGGGKYGPTQKGLKIIMK